MTSFELYTLVMQALVAAATFGALFLYYRQLRVMSEQLSSMQETSKAQSGLSLVNFLQDPEVRKARRTVRSCLSSSALEDWNEEEKEHAASVAANYDVTGALVKSGIVPVDLVAANWGPSIIHCYEVLKPWIELHQTGPGSHRSYWTNFEWLYRKAKAAC